MNLNESPHIIIEDEDGGRYTLVKELGKGGQGAVWSTDCPGIVVKLAFKNLEEDLIDREKDDALFCSYRERYERLTLLPLPPRSHVATPMALLRDFSGYAMRLMDDMESLASLSSIDSMSLDLSTYPAWLVGENTGSPTKPSVAQMLLERYRQTGSLRRRLELLTRLSTLLADLHGKGLVYGDLSVNNVFVTSDMNFPQPNVWLIDSDNLSIASADPSRGRKVFTPKYGSPEVVQGAASCSLESDVYSFAILAFECLALIHPFLGALSEGAESGNWDDSESSAALDPRDRALRGEFPWIEDESGENASSAGIPRALVLTGELRGLFDATLSDGRLSPEKRPPIFFLPEAFARAADTTMACPSCQMSWTDEFHAEVCPYCGAALPETIRIESSGKTVFARELPPGKACAIPERVFLPFDTAGHGNPLCAVEWKPEEGKRVITFIRSERADENSLVLRLSVNGKSEDLNPSNAYITEPEDPFVFTFSASKDGRSFHYDCRIGGSK